MSPYPKVPWWARLSLLIFGGVGVGLVFIGFLLAAIPDRISEWWD